MTHPHNRILVDVPEPPTPAPYVLPADAFTKLAAELDAVPSKDPYDSLRPTVVSDYRVGFGDQTGCLAIVRPPHSHAGYTPFLLACVIYDTLPDPTIADLRAIVAELDKRQHTYHEGHRTIDFYASITVAEPTDPDPGTTAATLTYTPTNTSAATPPATTPPPAQPQTPDHTTTPTP